MACTVGTVVYTCVITLVVGFMKAVAKGKMLLQDATLSTKDVMDSLSQENSGSHKCNWWGLWQHHFRRRQPTMLIWKVRMSEKKWVNFALVETGGADEPMPNAKSAADGDSACIQHS